MDRPATNCVSSSSIASSTSSSSSSPVCVVCEWIYNALPWQHMCNGHHSDIDCYRQRTVCVLVRTCGNHILCTVRMRLQVLSSLSPPIPALIMSYHQIVCVEHVEIWWHGTLCYTIQLSELDMSTSLWAFEIFASTPTAYIQLCQLCASVTSEYEDGIIISIIYAVLLLPHGLVWIIKRISGEMAWNWRVSWVRTQKVQPISLWSGFSHLNHAKVVYIFSQNKSLQLILTMWITGESTVAIRRATC